MRVYRYVMSIDLVERGYIRCDFIVEIPECHRMNFPANSADVLRRIGSMIDPK